MSELPVIQRDDSPVPARRRLHGRLLVGQAGGPSVAVNSILVAVVHEALEHGEIEAVYGMRDGILGAVREDLVDLGKESPATLEGLRYTPSAALGSSGYRLLPRDYDRILQVFRAHNARYFCYIGGKDALETALSVETLARDVGYELRVIGVPAAVSNDLPYTDHCLGYGSAARSVALWLRDSGLDARARALDTPIKMIELLGRSTGWLTAAAALAREGDENLPPNLIYVPERPFSVAKFLADVRQVYQDRGHCLVALSEGVRDAQGRRIAETLENAGCSPPGGPGVCLSQLVGDELGLSCCLEKPETIQRSLMACASPVDLQEAYMAGRMAVRAIVEGSSGQMVTLVRAPGPAYSCMTGLLDLAEVAGQEERRLPEEYLDERGHPTAAFVDYAQPLIGGQLPPYARLAGYEVPRRLGADRG